MKCTRRRSSLFMAVAALGLVPSLGFSASDTPPEGPPWKRDFLAAQREALQTSKPIFLYFTKTY